MVVVPLLLLAAIGVSTPLIDRAQGFDSDGKRYGAMADPDLFKPRFRDEIPWAWRVLTPALASWLPFETLTNFRVLAVLSNWLSLVLLYGILRRSGFTRELSLLGMGLYAGVFWSIKFFFYSPAYIDSGTQAIALAILYLAVTRHYAFVPVAIALGVLQKESILFLAPVVYAAYGSERGVWRPRSLAYAAALTLPAVGMLAALRLAIPGIGDYSPWSMVWSQIQLTAAPANAPRLLLALFSGLGILPLWLAVRPRDSLSRLRASPLWCALGALGLLLLVAGEDKARLFLYALPAVVVLAVGVAADLLEARDPRRVWVWVAIALALHLFLGHHLTPMGSFDAYLDRMVPMYASDAAVVSGLVRVAGVTIVFALASAVLLRQRVRS